MGLSRVTGLLYHNSFMYDKLYRLAVVIYLFDPIAAQRQGRIGDQLLQLLLVKHPPALFKLQVDVFPEHFGTEPELVGEGIRAEDIRIDPGERLFWMDFES